ncbi:oligosaccharide flippase family protein [Carnobacterium maltaromaticum]|uniref:oligosaccharide flippase family protein n=1 Tax=Carnobacterium maltaromaticum TaxID=2751 RepID=UPI0039B00C16
MDDLSQKSILKKLGALLLGNGMSQIINTFFVLILVRIFTQEQYAIYRLGNQLIMTVSPFFVFGLPMTISLFLPRYKELKDRRNFIFQTIFLLILLGAIGSLLLSLNKNFIFSLYKNAELLDFLWVFSLSFFSEVVFSYFPFYMTTENKNKKLAISVTMLSLLKLSSIFISMAMGNDFKVFMYTFAFSSLVKVIYVILEPLYYYKVKLKEITKIDIKKQLVESVPIGMTNVVTAFGKNLGNNLVAIKYTSLQYATYITGAFEVPFIGILRASITGAVLPSFSAMFSHSNKDKQNEIITSFRKTVGISGIIILPIMIGLITYSYGAISILFPKYTDANIIFKIYMLLLPTQIANFSTLLLVANKQMKVLLYSVGGILVNVLFFFIFYNTLGFYFVALSTVIAEYAQLIMILFDVKKFYHQEKLFSVLPIKDFTIVTISNILIYGAIYVVSNNFIDTNKPITALVLGGISFGICMLVNATRMPEIKNKLRKVRK